MAATSKSAFFQLLVRAITGAIEHPPDEQECLNDGTYLRDVYILVGSYVALLVLCCTTFGVRTWVARRHSLPLFGTHIFFLILILAALALRTVDLLILPCLFTIEDGATVLNLLANCPIMLMFTIFTMLLYHTFIVLHSIQLSCDPVLHSGSGMPSPLANSPLVGSPLMPSISSRESENNERVQGREIRDFSWPTGPEEAITLHNEHHQRRCVPTCPFWVVLCGRPHSSMKLLMIGLNVLVWLVFVALLVADSADMLVIEFHNGKSSGHLLAVYLLELPAIATAVIISMCFLVSGTKLINKLRNLHRMLHLERLQVSSGTIPGDESNGCTGSENAVGGQASNVSSVTSPVARYSLQANAQHEHLSLVFTTVSAQESVTRCSSMPNVSPSYSPRVSILASDMPDRSASHGESCRYRSKVAFSTMTMSLTWIYDEPSVAVPCVLPVICGVRRMLIVVCVCVMAFLLRAFMLTCFAFSSRESFPRHYWLPYLVLCEVAPYALLLLFYLIPGCQAMCAGSRRTDSIVPSHTESQTF